MTSTQFYCRITVFDRMLQDFTVFVWELEPLDGQTRSAREWIEEYIEDNYEELFPTLGIKGTGGWEAVFVATLRSSGPWMGREPDDSLEMVKWQAQVLPEEDE